MRTNVNARLRGLLVTVSSLGLMQGAAASANPQSAQSSGLPPAAATQAKESTLVRLDKSAARNFDTAFRAVSDQAHVLIVSEGTPLQASLTDEQVQSLQAGLAFDSPVAVADAVRVLAQAYDYYVEQPNPRTFLLCKRYTDPADLPCVTYDEITHSLRAVLQLIDAYSPETGPVTRTTAEELFDSLTPQQARKAKSAIALSDLGPQQQELALATLKSMTVDSRVELVRQLSRTLAIVNRRSTVLGWVDGKLSDQSHTSAFGLEGEFGADNARAGLPISFPFRPMGGPSYISLSDQFSNAGILGKAVADSSYYVTAPYKDADGSEHMGGVHYYSITPEPATSGLPHVSQGDPADQTKPTDLDRKLARGMLVNRLASTMTLREAVQKATGFTVDGVDKAIADKPVNVFGSQYAGGASFFVHALADVYGLQVVGDANHGVTLRLAEPLITEYPSQVPAQIERLIPLPLARSFANRKGTRGQNELYFSAVRRLIALVGPAVPTAASPPVQVETEGPEAKRLIALALLTGEPLRQLLALENYAPSGALMHPKTLRMTMVRDAAGKTPGLNLSYGHLSADGTGYKVDGTGFSMTMPPTTVVSGSSGK